MEFNENEIIEKLKVKDKFAFDQIVKLYTSSLCHAALGLGFNETEVDDIVQSVWMTFFSIMSQFEARSTIKTFLFGILYNKASEFRRKNQRVEPKEEIEQLLDSHFDQSGHWILSHAPISPDQFLERTQTVEIVSKCLEKLPLNQKMAFLMKEIEDESTEEISKVLKISISNLGVLLFRARNQLRICIEGKSRK